MAIIKPSSYIHSVRGTIGYGENEMILYSRDGRTVMRRKGRNNNPPTERQHWHRTMTSVVSRSYQQMPPIQYQNWKKLSEILFEAPVCKKSVRPQSVYHLYTTVTKHRLLAGQLHTYEPPRPEYPSGLVANPVVTYLSDYQLKLSFDHPYKGGSVYWRVHLSSRLPGTNALARPNGIRSPLPQPTSAYFISFDGSEEMTIHTESAYNPGDGIGISILTLSSDFLPGRETFFRRLDIGN